MNTPTALTRRGLAAFLKSTDKTVRDLSASMVEISNKRYVVVKGKIETVEKSGNRVTPRLSEQVILSVYRVRVILEKDVLKRLRRYPKEITI